MIDINLKGKLAVVTGGSGDLGRVTVRTLARAGADVVIHYLKNEKKANELVDEVKAMGQRALAVQADITDEKAILAMRDTIKKSLGDPQIIVNNAVIQYPWKSILEQPAEDYESQFKSCVMHNLFMIKAFVPAMIEKRYGRVIGINTECAMECFPEQSAYAAGKRGMDGLLRVLAREIGQHQITVNQIAPGWMISDRDRAKGDPNAKPYDKNPMKRRGTDQDVANLVVFLASDLANFINGAYVPVCGGKVMPTI